MQEIDHAFKTVVRLQPECILKVIFDPAKQIRFKKIADPQINLPELRADKALVVEQNGEAFGIICEAMLKPDASELPTFALKALGLQYLEGIRTVVVIVYMEKGEYATFPSSFENRVGDISNVFQLTKVLLWEYEPRILSGELKALAPFLPLFHENPDPEIIETQKALIAQVEDPKVRADLFSTAMVVDIRCFGLEVVTLRFHREVHMIKETSLVQNWLEESKKEGERRGRMTLLQELLTHKFGSLTPALSQQVHRLSDQQLSRLAAAILQMSSQEELQAWLGNGASQAGRS